MDDLDVPWDPTRGIQVNFGPRDDGQDRVRRGRSVASCRVVSDRSGRSVTRLANRVVPGRCFERRLSPLSLTHVQTLQRHIHTHVCCVCMSVYICIYNSI